MPGVNGIAKGQTLVFGFKSSGLLFIIYTIIPGVLDMEYTLILILIIYIKKQVKLKVLENKYSSFLAARGPMTGEKEGS